MLTMNVDCYHTTNRTATCNRPIFFGARGVPISSMVTVKIYDNGTYIGNSPLEWGMSFVSMYKIEETVDGSTQVEDLNH